jgi:flagellar biosynthesis GTPase FlhF
MSESRLKILQLEADRPLWEAAKKKREENERAERAKVEERRRAEEVEESRRKMWEFQEQDRVRKHATEEAERKERLRKEEEENARREEEEREAREKLEREKRWRAATQAEEERCQKHDETTWGAGAWTPARAVERLKLQMEEFDKIKFSQTQPLTFHVIPWPVLTDPLDLDIEQINWDGVEAFFSRAKGQFGVNVAGYNSLVEKVHRLFHPDKWKSRRLLVTVMDEELRKSLEEAGNVVAQAMTPIWRRSKGYNTCTVAAAECKRIVSFR